MSDLLVGSELHRWIAEWGSPLNVISTRPLVRNIGNLNAIANERALDFRVFFARKANKCLSLVDAALQCEAAIDVASLPELQQVIELGVRGSDVICTAAIKTHELLAECVRHQVTIVIDNADELQQLQRQVRDIAAPAASVALRISGFDHDGKKLHSRFGIDIDQVRELLQSRREELADGRIAIKGVHFHLDGYSADQRISAIRQCLPVIDDLRSHNHDIEFLDIGGGIPMSYLNEKQQWDQFHNAHHQALLDKRSPLTYRNHGLGCSVVDGKIQGARNTYPYHQDLVHTDWFTRVLDAPCEDMTIAKAIARRALQLRCEPGRSVLDGCGMTVASVAFRKQHVSGDWFIGLAMNGTQCRTGSDDFLVDPLLVPSSESKRSEALEGYLVGAYCTESELLTLRKLRFPCGVALGDMIVFPNTAGYFMHFLESRSHQFPLAKNVVLQPDGTAQLDRIDRPA